MLVAPYRQDSSERRETGDVHQGPGSFQYGSVGSIGRSGQIEELMFREARTELDCVLAHLIAFDAFFEKISLAAVPGWQFLKRTRQFSAGPEGQFDQKGNAIVSRDVEVQLERAAVLDHGHLLIERLDIAHLAVREIQLAPKNGSRARELMRNRPADSESCWATVDSRGHRSAGAE